MSVHRLARVRELGVKSVCFGGLEVARNRLLRQRYGFESWHVGAPYYLRPYKKVVIQTIEQYEPSIVVEIGCGLGDVISRVDCETRIGLDQSQGVVAAATRLHPNSRFRQAQLDGAGAALAPLVPNVDVLVMVNWPHLLPMEEIQQSLALLRQTIPLHYLVIDGVHGEAASYRFRHSREDLESLGHIDQTVADIDDVRDLYVLDLSHP